MDLALAHHRDQHVERLFRDAVDLFDVQQRSITHCRDERTIDEDVGVVAIGQHPCRVEVADQASRRQFGVALDEFEAEAELVGDSAQQRALARARRTFQQHMTVGGQRSDNQLDFALSPHDAAEHALDQRGGISHGYSYTNTPRMFLPAYMSA